MEKTLGTQGLPRHLALAIAELYGALGFEEPVIFPDDIIQVSDSNDVLSKLHSNDRYIFPQEHRLTSWTAYVKEENWSPIL